MFITNKYTKWYFAIISNAISQSRVKGNTYFEKHHILPRCMSGTDDAANLVLLTIREHYIAHWLLTKMVPSNTDVYYKLEHAFSKMTWGRKLPSHVVNIMKSHKHSLSSVQFKGVKKSPEHKRKISEALKGKPKSIESRAKMSLAKENYIPWNVGRQHSPDTIDKIREKATGKKASDETKRKMRESRLRYLQKSSQQTHD